MNEFWIDDLITLDGRTFTVHGFDPMSLPEQMVELTETATGESARVPLALLDAAGVVSSGSAGRKRPQRAWLRRRCLRQVRAWRC